MEENSFNAMLEPNTKNLALVKAKENDAWLLHHATGLYL